MKIEVVKLSPHASIPEHGTAGSAGLDLRACITSPLTLGPGDSTLVPSGLAIYIKHPNVVGLIVPRSGLGAKHGIVLGNLTGVIDSDYQGEVKISLWNRGKMPYMISPRERVAQLLFVPVLRPELVEVDCFAGPTARGVGGFGSTGDK